MDYLSQFQPICNTMSGFITVCFDHQMFRLAGYKNKAIAAGCRLTVVFSIVTGALTHSQ
jgi:hypothetical protein